MVCTCTYMKPDCDSHVVSHFDQHGKPWIELNVVNNVVNDDAGMHSFGFGSSTVLSSHLS